MYFIEPKKVPERDPKESLLHVDVAEPSPMGLWRCGQLCGSSAGSDSFARSKEGGIRWIAQLFMFSVYETIVRQHQGSHLNKVHTTYPHHQVRSTVRVLCGLSWCVGGFGAG